MYWPDDLPALASKDGKPEKNRGAATHDGEGHGQTER